jgi:signal transduction histidine kinase
MSYRQLFILLSMLAVCQVTVRAQYIGPDSLRKIISSAKEDRVRIDAMNKLSFRYYQDLEMDSSRYWVEQALGLSKSTSYNSGTGIAYINIGNLTAWSWKHLDAIEFYKKAILELTKENNKAYIGTAYLSIGQMYHTLERYTESLENIYKGFRYASDAGYENGIAQFHLIIGMHYSECNNNDDAIRHFNTAIDLYKKLGEHFNLAITYFNKGYAEIESGQYASAVDNFFSARTVARGTKSASWFDPEYYRALGLFYSHQGDSCKALGSTTSATRNYALAKKNFSEALQKCLSDDDYEKALIHHSLGLFYYKNNKLVTAKIHIQKSLQFLDPLRDKRLSEKCYLALAKIDSANQNFQGAYKYLLKYLYYHDELNNKDNIQKREQYKVKAEIEKKESEVKILTTENQLKSAIASKQRQQKNFALAGLCLLAISGSFSFIRFRNKKRIQNQRQLIEQKQRISRDLHDEIGATLSGIAMYSHLAKTSLSDRKPDEANNSVNIIQHSATEMVTKLNDIIWLINPGKESLDDLIAKLKEYAQNMCMASNITLQVEVSGETASFPLPIEARKNIYLLCKEAINNAAKYSNASLLIMTFCLQENNLEINIKDDGKGFDITTVKQGNGLENMQKRADDFGGKLQLITSPGNGTHWQLSTKITHQGIA